MPRTRRCPRKRISTSPEAQDSVIESTPAGASRRSSQSGSLHRSSKTALEIPLKRKPVPEVPETPAKRRYQSSSVAPEEDGDLPFHPKPTCISQPKKNERQEEAYGTDEWAVPISEPGGIVDGDYEGQNMADTESNSGGREDEVVDSGVEREEEYEREQQYHREEIKRKSSEWRDLEFKAKGKVQTSLRTYSKQTAQKDCRSVATMTALPPHRGPFKKRDPMRNDSARAIEINDDDEDHDLEEDMDLQEALRRSIHDTGGGPPRYHKLEPENSKVNPVTIHHYPLLPEPSQVQTIGKSDALMSLNITLEFVDVPLPPAAPKARVMTVRFPLSLVGKKDLLHCVSTHGTSILFVWNKNVHRGIKNKVIDLENLHLYNSQSLPETGKAYLGGEGMGKVEIPKGYNIMRTTEKIKCCDTGSGFSMREYLIGISREKEQRKGEGAWVVVRVGIVPVSNGRSPSEANPSEEKGKEAVIVECGLGRDEIVGEVTPRSLMPPSAPTRLQRGRRAMSPASPRRGDSPDLSAITPVNLFGAKNIRPNDLDLWKAGPEIEMEIPRNYKSLGEEIAEDEGATESSTLSEGTRKRGRLSKDGLLGYEYDSGLEEGIESPVKKLKVNLKGFSTGTSDGDGERTSRQHGTAVLGRNPRAVMPVKEKTHEEMIAEEEVEDKRKEKEQEKKEKGKVGKLTKSAQKARTPGPGGVMGGTCVKKMGDITLDGEDAFDIAGGDLYVPDIA